MKCHLTKAAWTDLEVIGDYISQDSPLRAHSFVNELLDHCERLTDFPEANRIRDDIGPDIRIAIHDRYLIAYRISGEQLRIERILQASQNWSGDNELT